MLSGLSGSGRDLAGDVDLPEGAPAGAFVIKEDHRVEEPLVRLLGEGITMAMPWPAARSAMASTACLFSGTEVKGVRSCRTAAAK
jgi:hypothetical protein